MKESRQITMDLSPYQGLYEAIIPQDRILSMLKENIDFSFVNPMLRKQYCERFGRPVKEPEMMFKLLFLKKLYDLSDERLECVSKRKNVQIRADSAAIQGSFPQACRGKSRETNAEVQSKTPNMRVQDFKNTL